jgi:endonuclease/exonuclease/phosphatase family metal-dependent hydrolase
MTNLEKLTSFIASQKADAIMLQEVDLDASRSFGVNEFDHIKGRLKGYAGTFGINYKVPWVPVPWMNPMGHVNSGLASFTAFSIASCARYQYPGGEDWPRQVFELDRCFVENRLPVAGGKELVLINSHLSAFDQGGKVRKLQLGFLKNHIIGEYNKGNYVIVGGDWNHALPGADPALFKTTEEWPFWLQKLPDDFTPAGFTWGVDKNVPSVRTNAKPYVKGENFRVVIDGFLVSPNVTIVKVEGHDLDFENSDHNPVMGVFELNR